MSHAETAELWPFAIAFEYTWMSSTTLAQDISPFGWFVIQNTITVCNPVALAMKKWFQMEWNWILNLVGLVQPWPMAPHFRNGYLHLTSNFASTDNDLVGYDSWSATHFMVSPCRSLVAGIWTIDVADHVRLLPVSRVFVWVWSGFISWSPALFSVNLHSDAKCKCHIVNEMSVQQSNTLNRFRKKKMPKKDTNAKNILINLYVNFSSICTVYSVHTHKHQLQNENYTFIYPFPKSASN